jgi:hypothetical protein
MKVKKFESVPAPEYPSHRQFAECKLLLGAAVIGLGSAVMAANEPPPKLGGDIKMEPRKEAPAKPAVKTPSKPLPPNAAGGIRVEPKPMPPQVALGGVMVAEPKPAPPPAK